MRVGTCRVVVHPLHVDNLIRQGSVRTHQRESLEVALSDIGPQQLTMLSDLPLSPAPSCVGIRHECILQQALPR
ncbi:hypothetical protein Ais01nite_21120 [Asanoa ishikariensis]|nr:hypothetical protein Ais01nite_21120 [Asanoa ishikariensis]